MIAYLLGLLTSTLLGGGPNSTPPSFRLLSRDHIGSVTTVFNEAGAVSERSAYGPDGESFARGLVSPRYATKEMDFHGFYELGSCLYDCKLRMRLSKDATYHMGPSRQAPDPAQLNLYQYALNNPLRYVDPTGHVVVLGPDLRAAQAILHDLRMALPKAERSQVKLGLHKKLNSHVVLLGSPTKPSMQFQELGTLVKSNHQFVVHAVDQTDPIVAEVGGSKETSSLIGLGEEGRTAVGVTLPGTALTQKRAVSQNEYVSPDDNTQVYYAKSQDVTDLFGRRLRINRSQADRSGTLIHELTHAWLEMVHGRSLHGDTWVDQSINVREAEAMRNATVP